MLHQSGSEAPFRRLPLSFFIDSSVSRYAAADGIAVKKELRVRESIWQKCVQVQFWLAPRSPQPRLSQTSPYKEPSELKYFLAYV